MALNSNSFESIKRDLFSDQPEYTEGIETTYSFHQKILANNTTLTKETDSPTIQEIQTNSTVSTEETETQSSYQEIKANVTIAEETVSPKFQELKANDTTLTEETSSPNFKNLKANNTTLTAGTETTLSSYQKLQETDTDLTEETTLPSYQNIHANNTTLTEGTATSHPKIPSNYTSLTEDTDTSFPNIQANNTMKSTKSSKSNKLSLRVYVNDKKNKGEERLETVLKDKNPVKCVTLSTNPKTQDEIEMNLSTLDINDEDTDDSVVEVKENISSNKFVIMSKKTEDTFSTISSGNTLRTRKTKNSGKRRYDNLLKKWRARKNNIKLL